MSKGVVGLISDLSTKALLVAQYPHYQIHDGSHFYIHGYQDLSINQVLDFTIQTPNTTKQAHLTFSIGTESETLWQFYETVVATNPLSGAVTLLNNNRNSTKTSILTVKFEIQTNLAAANNDTNVTGGTLLASGISGAGRDGGEEERDHEILLKQNTLYCFRFTATTAGYVNYDAQWYEQTSAEPS